MMRVFFENLTIALQEAIDIEKGEIQMIKKFDNPAPTYMALKKESATEGKNIS
ncbi:MAG: hypothetical protein IJ029_03710 [Lachnospiraceae bacterium]|nr:hypothetical protein [Lachnospiraceae bacterium]